MSESSISKEQAAKQSALSIAQVAIALSVESSEDALIAEGLLVRAGQARARVEEVFNPQIRRASELHKSLLAEKRKFTDPIDHAEAIIKPKLADYFWHLDQKRLAEARERQRIKEQIEQTAATAADEAHALIKKGDPVAAAEIIEEGYAKVVALEAAAPEIVIDEKPETVIRRTTWDFEITDEAAVPLKYKIPDLKLIGQIVRVTKDQTAIAGVRAFPVRSVAAKGKR